MNTWQKLKWLILSGITENIGEQPVNRLAAHKPTVPGSEPVQAISDAFTAQADRLAADATSLEQLYANRASLNGCSLIKTAAHTLNGRGVSSPLVLCLIEAPDTQDDRTGLLMSDEAGLLFDKMLGAIGLSLQENTYVSALIPWRPPGNRKPTEAEHALCHPFWEREIQLLKPHYLLLFGAGVAGAVLGINSLARARGTWHDYHGIPTRVSIPPHILLQMPAQKKQAWEDLKKVQEKLTTA